jgi:hypothetical protein
MAISAIGFEDAILALSNPARAPGHIIAYSRRFKIPRSRSPAAWI